MSTRVPNASGVAVAGSRRREPGGRPRTTATAAPRTIAVAIHDIEPATYARCAVMREWLADHGVDRVTLLVIPARDLHHFDVRSPELVDWLAERRSCGDAVAQHGFVHCALASAANGWRLPVALARSGEAEFRGLDVVQTRRAVNAGWRVLKLAGVEPSGFVAPGYAYTAALRETLAERFDWWAGLLRVHSTTASGPRQARLAPAFALSGAGPVRRALSPWIVRAGAMLAADTLRIDLRPSDLEHPRHMMFLERLLAESARRRTAVTYDELAAG